MIKKYAFELNEIFDDSFQPFPKISDRTTWDNIDDSLKSIIIKNANEYLNKNFEVLPATSWLAYTRTGNRNDFQNRVNERRQGLHYLLLAELIKNNNKYIDQIVNVLWMTMEETSWIIHAHNALGGMKLYRKPLPEMDNPIIDLMSGETGVSVALTYYFLKDKLDAVSPMICHRIEKEITKRVIKPYQDRNDYWWMGLCKIKLNA